MLEEGTVCLARFPFFATPDLKNSCVTRMLTGLRTRLLGGRFRSVYSVERGGWCVRGGEGGEGVGGWGE